MKQTNAHLNILLSGSFGSDTGFIKAQIEKGGNFFAELLQQICTVEQLKGITSNQKGVKRFVQSLNFALNGDIKSFDAVTAYMVSCVALTKESTITFQNAHFLCGVHNENANLIKGVSKAKVSRFIGNAGTKGTISSKVSRTSGKNGFFTHLNITNKSDANSFTLTSDAKSNPLILAYAYQLERMTESTFLTVKDKVTKL
jgi:hypothetical protein